MGIKLLFLLKHMYEYNKSIDIKYLCLFHNGNIYIRYSGIKYIIYYSYHFISR